MKKIIPIFLAILIIPSIWLFKKSSAPSVSNITISYAGTYPNLETFLHNENDYNLVNLISLNTNLSIDLKYATTDNFAGIQFYPKIAKAYLREGTAKKLMAANEEFYSLGYRIKIFDAYRPRRYQYDLREAARQINPATQGYIANPDTGSHHNRGASVDITLTDLEGHELDMPTGFDHFGPEASITYNGCTEEQKANRELLGTIMEQHGFRRISSEWWHFDDKDYLDYELLDVDFAELD
ncbi:MAG: M15 family metallopeptidase [Clostridia bacterium]|nr:M15 family metallopeptidase [Clostridia bacterium]